MHCYPNRVIYTRSGHDPIELRGPILSRNSVAFTGAAPMKISSGNSTR